MKPQTDTYQINYGSDVSQSESQQWNSNKSLLNAFPRSRSKRRLFMIVIAAFVGVVVIIGLAVGLSVGLRNQRSTTNKYEFLREAGAAAWSEEMVTAGVFQKSAVSSDYQICSEIGSYFLARNGSAVDAAVATQLCAGLYAPHSMGIGGGFFMIVYDRATQNATVIDARETAPQASTVDMYSANATFSKFGPLAVAVPGELHGLAHAHRLYGRIPWKELLQPIIELCYHGTKVSTALARALKESRSRILSDPGFRAEFFRPNSDEVLVEGDVIKRPKLARTLETISQNGVDAFYNGQIGLDLIDELKEMGGILTMEDLSKYRSKIRQPIVTDMSNNLRLHSIPPPASGAIIANIMHVLDGYRFDLKSEIDPIIFNHRVIEAFKFAYAYRAEIGDPDFINMTQLVLDLTSTDIAAKIREKIWNNQTFTYPHYQPLTNHSTLEDHGTSHISVLAPNGDAVSVTSTINLYFGCGILSQATGIILNDEMDDFSSPNLVNYFGVEPSSSNYIAPNKRPVSSIAASIFTNSETGEVRLVTGAAGGTRITTATAYTTVKHLWAKEELKQAIEDFRIHHQLHPSSVEFESGFSEETMDGLKKLGHNFTESKVMAVVNAIAKYNDNVYAVADIRKKGGVSGFKSSTNQRSKRVSLCKSH